MRILVLGATGMLGHRVLLELLRDGSHQVGATYRSEHKRQLTGEFFEQVGVSCDDWMRYDPLTDLKGWGLTGILGWCKPDLIINCIGVLKHNLHSGDTLRALKLNAELPHLIASKLFRAGMVTFSSDCVFQGNKAEPYYPYDAPDATDLYGRTKALGEVLSNSNVLTLRTSFIGYELVGATSLLEWFLKAASAGEEIAGYHNARWSGVTTAYLARLMVQMAGAPDKYFPPYEALTTVVASPTNKYDLLQNINEALGLGVGIEKCLLFEAGKVCNRAMYPSLAKWAPYDLTWDVGDELMNDIVGERDMYQKWRASCS